MNITVELIGVTCAECGTPFAIEGNMDRSAREKGSSFYCPNGHSLSYSKGENAKLKDENRRLKDQLEAEHADLEQRRERARLARLARQKKHLAAVS